MANSTNVNPPAKAEDTLFSSSIMSDMFSEARFERQNSRAGARSSRNNSHSHASPSMGRRPERPMLGSGSGYYDFQRRGSMHRNQSGEGDFDRIGSRGSFRQTRQHTESIPRAPSFGHRVGRSRSYVSGRHSPYSQAGGISPHVVPSLTRHSSVINEKHTPPPYDTSYTGLVEGEDDDLVEMMRERKIKRMIKYSLYGLLGLIVLLACILCGYFLTPRLPSVALHAIDSPQENPGHKFKLHGTKMLFHVELTYRVQNDNYFDMVVDDISSAVFWPETKFALGGGRLSNIRVPSRKIVEITIPITIRYDVKRGPPPILLGMVESCGLHDTGVGEMNLEAEVQADFHTKLKQSSLQSGRQSVSVKCPVRRMATLQVEDGTMGNLGDIVRTLNA
ncbi:hypothetical protein GGI07_003387 [Coemansia sp. Benny D115]|nr:hypothetical protein GGI07_003387 [Coemansia sp. Benny D115]